MYFYCSRDQAELGRSNPEKVLASIARQLSCVRPGGPILPAAVTKYRNRKKDGFAAGRLLLHESRDLIMQLVDNYPKVTIIIDALDEVDSNIRDRLLETLEHILQEATTLIKIFISSRDDQDIVCQLQGYPNLEISSEKNSGDIEKFVRSETRKLLKRKPLRFSTQKVELQQLILDRIINGAHGM